MPSRRLEITEKQSAIPTGQRENMETILIFVFHPSVDVKNAGTRKNL